MPLETEPHCGGAAIRRETTPRNRFLAAAAALALLFFCILAGGAAEGAQAVAGRKPTADEREFASFIDGFFAGVQREFHIPGLVFVAVRDGKVLYLKGYGQADLAAGTPALPDVTRFRVGEISTLVTSTALLQLVEKGRLSLDEDVNAYLRRWRIPGKFERPLTLRHLLTHTAGFDDRTLEVGAPTSADERAYGARLPKVLPSRYAEPGEFYSYSSLGYTLMGSIIERYSRQNFPQAVERHIFTPLGMRHSTFFPSAEAMRELAAGYDREGGIVPYAYRYDMPAMGMSTTAADMGRFMLAQLDGGAIGRHRILGEMYAGSMLRTHFTPHPKIDGTGLAYAARRVQGVRTLQRNGGLPGYSSFLMLIPEKRFGLFYVANTSDANFSEDLANAVVSRFFPMPHKAAPAPATNLAHRRDVAGFYRSNRIARHTAEKALHLFADQIRVTQTENGIALSHTRNVAVPPTEWTYAGSTASGDLFVRTDAPGTSTPSHLFFQRNAEGRVAALTVGEVGDTFDKLRRVEEHYAQTALLVLFAAVALVSPFGALLGSTINKGKLPWEKDLRAATELWVISSLFCLVQAAFAATLFLYAHYMWDAFVLFVPYRVKALFVIPLAGGILLAWFWFRLLSNMLNPDHHWAEKLALFLLAVGETGYMLFLVNWRLLGFMF